ncbi:MAG TPA: LysR substrate-binding domain-containing protein [Chitinophagaceae bacterium]|nr:LysR substrate-binding domain-containing protein [Chitinophagaceae bacterium]
MNFSQLEYVIAVDNYRQFNLAAEKCFVTQATLSMMIRKLEEELDIKIFERSRQPVTPTREGEQIILRARQIVAEANALRSYVKDIRGEISGELRLGVIPTLAPYLLPLFLRSFTEKFPGLKIFIRELVTDEIITKLRTGELDIGLLATPLHEASIDEHPLFYEEFFAYVSRNEKLARKKYLLPKEIYLNSLWLLEEGHCLRNQVFNLCELKMKDSDSDRLHYQAGSIETLINLVDKNDGITIVPYLATQMLKPGQKKNLREFANPKPVREVSLVTNKNFARRKLLEHLKEEITGVVPASMLNPSKTKVTALV